MEILKETIGRIRQTDCLSGQDMTAGTIRQQINLFKRKDGSRPYIFSIISFPAFTASIFNGISG